MNRLLQIMSCLMKFKSSQFRIWFKFVVINGSQQDITKSYKIVISQKFPFKWLYHTIFVGERLYPNSQFDNYIEIRNTKSWKVFTIQWTQESHVLPKKKYKTFCFLIIFINNKGLFLKIKWNLFEFFEYLIIKKTSE